MSEKNPTNPPNRSPFRFVTDFFKRFREMGFAQKNARVVFEAAMRRINKVQESLGLTTDGAPTPVNIAEGAAARAFEAARRSGAITDAESTKYLPIRTISADLKSVRELWQELVLYYRTEEQMIIGRKYERMKTGPLGYAELASFADETLVRLYKTRDEILALCTSARDDLQRLIQDVSPTPIGKELDAFLLEVERIVEKLEATKRA